MRKLFSILVCLVACTTMLMAQQKTVTGRVISSEDGEPVIGATVVVTGTTTGTTTDGNGNFKLSVPVGGAKSVTVSYIGMDTKEVSIKEKMHIYLSPAEQVLDDVVVTAMGISKNEKSLGYAAATIKGDDLTLGDISNAAASLQGKVAGVQVSTASSDPGQAVNIVIRGFSSIGGSNQPLYIVDGVPLQNVTMSSQSHSNALAGISNIAPDDIASMTILKGAAATALYGSRAANGVVVVTTKGGTRGSRGRTFNISYDYGWQGRQVSFLPDMQNEYGQGWNGQQTWIENGSWGPAFDGSQQVFGPIWNGQQLIHEYSAVKDNVKDFFELGISQSHNVILNGVSDDDKMSYYLSYGYTKDDGIMPSSADSYKRNTLAFRTAYDAAKWLKLSSSVNLANARTKTVGNFQGTSVIDGLLEMPRDMNIVDHKDLSSPFNTPEAYFTPYGITNPYWALANHKNEMNSKQVNGKIQADIKPWQFLTFTYRFGFDYVDFDSKLGNPQIDLDDSLIDDDMGYPPSSMNESGMVQAYYGRRYELNHDAIVNFRDAYVDKKLDVNVSAGLNVNERYSTSLSAVAEDLTFLTGFWDLSNGASWTTMSETQWKRRQVALFGDATIGWDETFFLNLTGRNEWSSTLPLEKNNYFYGGITGSYIFSNMLPENDVLTYGKVRAAFGKTGNDAGVYLTKAKYAQAYTDGTYGYDISKFPMNGINAFESTGTAGSSSLKPEMTKEFEVGADLQFLDGRIGLDASYYNRVTSDQIFTLPVDPASGYSRMVTNFGEVRNRGVELVLNTTPVRTKNWRWDLSLNWAKNYNKVLSVPESLEGGRVTIYGFSAGNDAVYMYAEEGKELGTYWTYLPTYDPEGHIIVDQNGMPVLTDDLVDTGKTMNHKWTGGLTTSVSAYGFTLSAALDVRYGGYMFSRSKNLAQFTGNSVVTTFNERRPFIIPNSVVSDGQGGYVENTTPIFLLDGSYQEYFNDYGYGYGGEAYLVDRSYAKLRNITLGYRVPRKWVQRTGFLSSAEVSVFCNNVFTWVAKDNYFVDPESSTVTSSTDLAAQFGELYVNPSCRVWGFNVGLKF